MKVILRRGNRRQTMISAIPLREGAIALALLAGSTAPAIAQSLADPLDREFECIIEPQQMVKLSSPVVGVIARIDVDRGDVVHKGQVVGQVEDGVEAAALAVARTKAKNEFTIASISARLAFLRNKFGRADALVSKAIVAKSTAEEAESDAKVAEQQLKEAELNLELARAEVLQAEKVVEQRILRSPIDGIVMERLLVPGEYRNDQSPIMTLAQIDPLRVEVFLPTAYFGKVHVGTEAMVKPEEPIGGAYKAAVTVVDRVHDAASGTFGVRLSLPNEQLSLPAGIRCKVRFALSVAAAPAATTVAGAASR
jgi:RND family efflux transporter MFP subunit